MLPAHPTFFSAGPRVRGPAPRTDPGFVLRNPRTGISGAQRIALGLGARRGALTVCLLLLAMATAGAECRAQTRLPSGKGQTADLSSEGPQKRQGDLFIADNNV